MLATCRILMYQSDELKECRESAHDWHSYLGIWHIFEAMGNEPDERAHLTYSGQIQ
jgi:hypothetical protein